MLYRDDALPLILRPRDWQPFVRITDLTSDFAAIVKASHGTIEFKAKLWAWLDAQRRSGSLAPLLEDMERYWSSVGQPPSLSEARDLLRHLNTDGHTERVHAIGQRFAEVTGELPTVEVVLLAGLERPEGYSRFDRGRNTIFLGLDHPSALANYDHLELILSHELCHAVRDPDPRVLADHGGVPEMTHDDFVARNPFREHLVSEGLATAISELAYPGRPARRYVYFDEEAFVWCEGHRREIAERMMLALERGDPYQTFYAEGSVTPDSPDCCDYWFGLHLARYALERESAGELLRTPATSVLGRHLQPFLDYFLAGSGVTVRAPKASGRRRPRTRIEPDADDALAGASLPQSVRLAYDEYAALLAAKPGLADELEGRFAAELTRQELSYAGTPWDVHAFPLLLDREEERHVRWATEGVLRLVERVVEMYRTDREVRAFFRLPRQVEELCMLEPNFRPHVMLGRFDSFWSGRRMRFLELNANGTAGWKLAEALGEVALEMPGLGEILERRGARATPLCSRVLEGLLSAWHQARGESAVPRRIAIVDWPLIATSAEQTQLATDFTAMGVPTDFVPPSALRFDGRDLHGPDGPIDIVYRRFTMLELVDRYSELEALLDAARAGAVVTVGSFASDVAHSKRLFAFLTHERWQRRLAPEERALVDAHVPWTRMFLPGRTQFDGRMCDLRALAIAERERFVLKPAESYEGRGVMLGAETEPEAWQAEVDRRLGGDHVIQERVRAPVRRLLIPRDGRAEEVPHWLHLGQFVIGGQLAGMLARASRDLVLSVDSDERTLPCLVLGRQGSRASPASGRTAL